MVTSAAGFEWPQPRVARDLDAVRGAGAVFTRARDGRLALGWPTAFSRSGINGYRPRNLRYMSSDLARGSGFKIENSTAIKGPLFLASSAPEVG